MSWWPRPSGHVLESTSCCPCSGDHILAVHPGGRVLASTSWGPCSGDHILGVTFWWSCLGGHVLVAMSWWPCPGGHIQVVTSWRLRPGDYVLVATTWWPHPGSQVPAVMSWRPGLLILSHLLFTVLPSFPVNPDEQMLTQHCLSRPVSRSDQDRNAKTTYIFFFKINGFHY